jgi:hypothetical protein
MSFITQYARFKTIYIFLGWAQTEIGEWLNLTHQAVGEIAKKFDIELFCKEYKSGMTPKKIASSHNLDEPLVWSVPYLVLCLFQ